MIWKAQLAEDTVISKEKFISRIINMNLEKPQIKVEQGKSEKELAWEKKRKEIDEIIDIVGHKIDNGIKETVVAFDMNGLPTHNSCEGHIDHGFPYPFVEVTAGEEKTKLEKKLKERRASMKKFTEFLREKYLYKAKI
ncbi:MAG: hypothetical protein ACE5F2_02940 [Candidatus Paceibacteria bacterium]